MVSVLRRCSKAKGKFATSPSHASNSGTTISLNSVEDVPLIVSSQDEQFQPSPPIAPSITLSHSEDVTLPTTDFTSTKVKSGRTRGKGLSKMNKSFGKKLKVHVDLIKWKDMEVHDFNLALDNLDLHMEIEDIGDEAIQEKIEQLLKNRSRNARYKLHKHFKKLTTLEEAQRNKTKENGLTQDNWNLLCKYWSDPNVKAKCEKNVENRTKNTMPHNQGSVALVVVRNEIEEKELNGEECDRISFFKFTHFKEGKGWMPPKAEAKYVSEIN
ncbi:uncharacterized protein LOC116140237 isoform X2 [Pistacia vera]|uniref:uncharacterized protein LOC116140237 isoform X2 n=2 Tax=Pistacia vera TaxID=55513 RepID=UPI0012638E1C|nr:uncharacterized protein LOC116140237 isoform X2 [Pistacia vera]